MGKKLYNILFLFLCITLSININYEFKNIFINLILFVIPIILSSFLVHKKDKKIHTLKYVVSILFSIFMVLGSHYIKEGSNILVNIVKLVGYTFLFRNMFILLDDKLNNLKKEKKKKYSKLFSLLDKYPFISSFIIIFTIFLIYMIAFYPIILSPDPSNQIKMYFNVETHYIKSVKLINPNVLMTQHHPVLHTMLLGLCLSMGRMILNDNFGLFIYSFMQSIILISVLSYTIKFLKDNNVSLKWRNILLLIYMFVPMYSFYSMSAVKDTLYTSFMILFVLFIFDYIKNKKELTLKNIIYLFILLMLISMLRNNGKYVVLLSMLFLIPYNKVNIKKLIFTTIIFFITFFMYDKVLIPSFGISPTSLRETLSVPFQQTARLVKKYPNFYTEEEQKKINKVLKYKVIGERYNPNLADPVKNTYRTDVSMHKLMNYFKVWFKGFIHHPILYVDATLNNTYGYISPNSHNWYIYSKYDDRITQNNLVDYHYNNCSTLRKILSTYGDIFPFIPIIGLISNIAFGTWIIIISIVYLFLKKKEKYILAYIPLLGSLIFCFLGPANTYFRYAMPYLFVLPVLSILILNELRGVKNEK